MTAQLFDGNGAMNELFLEVNMQAPLHDLRHVMVICSSP